MIKKVSSIYDLNKVMRTQLIAQTGLANDHVLNGLSLNGSNLEKRLENQVFRSFEISDCFVVFALEARQSSSNNSQVLDNDDLLVTSSYSFTCIIYGPASMLTAQIIKSRFESEEVRQLLFDQGIYIEAIGQSQSFNEFLNDTMWLRTDISIEISCETLIEKLSTSAEFENISKLRVNDFEEDPALYGSFSGIVRDATSGSPIYGISVYIRSGGTDGQIVEELTTTDEGYYETGSLAYGTYYAQFVDEEGEYIQDYLRVELNQEILEDKDIILSKSIASNSLRAVLTWARRPNDLDAHLKTSTDFHVYYDQLSADGGNITLDIDAQEGLGPETISVAELDPTTIYRFYVHNFQPSSGSFAISNAIVKVYKGDNILYVFNVPEGTEDYWLVFDYSSSGGLFIINQLTNNEPGYPTTA